MYADCFNQNGTSNPSYAYIESCTLIARDQDGYRATVITPYINLGGIETSGIDRTPLLHRGGYELLISAG